MDADLERVARGAAVSRGDRGVRDADHARAHRPRRSSHGRDDDRAGPERHATSHRRSSTTTSRSRSATSGRCGRGSRRSSSCWRPSSRLVLRLAELEQAREATIPVELYRGSPSNRREQKITATRPRLRRPARSSRTVQEGARLQAGSGSRHDSAQGRRRHDLGLDGPAEGGDPGRRRQAVDRRAAALTDAALKPVVHASPAKPTGEVTAQDPPPGSEADGRRTCVSTSRRARSRSPSRASSASRSTRRARRSRRGASRSARPSSTARRRRTR